MLILSQPRGNISGVTISCKSCCLCNPRAAAWRQPLPQTMHELIPKHSVMPEKQQIRAHDHGIVWVGGDLDVGLLLVMRDSKKS